MFRRTLEFLVRVKRGLKKKVESVGPDCRPPAADDEDDGEPLTWAEQKNVRKELRRFQLWHALRVKVPKGFEEGA